jgi:ribonuclease D
MEDEQSLPTPIWVDKPAGLRAMLAHLKGEKALAVDTESNSLYVYHEQVCLIQISIPGTDYLIDSLALADLSGLAPLLADPAVLKVLHGAEYDLSVLHRDYGFTLVNLFDTMWASRILGWSAHGLAALLKTHFGVRLDKRYQRANWGVRPLPTAQLNYARLDTHFLLPLYRIQAQALKEIGRWPQARHRFSRLIKTRPEPKGFDPDGFWRLPGARDLDDAGRGVLRSLYLFRDEQARAENRPPFRVLSNRALVTLSQIQPSRLASLHKVKGVSPRLARKYGKGLLPAIQEGIANPLAWDKRPRYSNASTGKPNCRPSAACQARFDALRTWRNATAEARGVEPDIVLTNQILWAVAHRNPRCRADLIRDDLLVDWQANEFGDQVLAIVKRAR